MRALIVSAVFPPELVVSGRLSAEVTGELAARGHDVTAVTAFPSHPAGRLYAGFTKRLFDRRADEQGFLLVRCFSFFAGDSRMVTRFVENVSFGLTSGWIVLTLPRPDVIYSNTWPIFASALLLLSARLRRAPLVISVQDVYPESLVAQGRIGPHHLLARLIEWLDGIVARGAAAVVVISENFADVYRQRRRVAAERIHVVPNWSDTPVDPCEAEAGDFRRKMNIPEGALLAVYGGTIGVAAGVETVLEAFRAFESLERFHLLIAGDGSRVEACRQLAAKVPGGRALVRSPWPIAETAQTLAAADVLLLPTRGAQSLASVPAKLIAYMFAARPVVASALRASDVAQMIERAGCGWIVEPDRPEALARLLEQVAGMDRGELQRRGQAGRTYAVKHLTREACLPRLADLLEQVGR